MDDASRVRENAWRVIGCLGSWGNFGGSNGGLSEKGGNDLFVVLRGEVVE